MQFLGFISTYFQSEKDGGGGDGARLAMGWCYCVWVMSACGCINLSSLDLCILYILEILHNKK